MPVMPSIDRCIETTLGITRAIWQILFPITSWFLKGSVSGVDQGPLKIVLD